MTTQRNQAFRIYNSALLKAALCLVCVGAFASAEAAQVSIGASQPTVDGADIANFISGGTDATNVGGGPDQFTYVAGDRPAQGQAFTTGTSGTGLGYTLDAITLQHRDYSAGFNDNLTFGTLTIRIGTVADGVFTSIATETVAMNGDNGFISDAGSEFVTFSLDSPVLLSDGTVYGFDVGSNGGFFETNGTNVSDVLAGSFAYNSGMGGVGTNVATQLDFDRVFHLNLAETTNLPDVWNVDSDGNWNTASNWLNGVPGTGSDPILGNIITADRTVTLDVSPVVNSVTFNNVGDGDYFVVPQTNQSLTVTSGDITTSGRHWLRANLAGTAINASGSGELVLDAANSFTGALTVDGTDVTVTNTGAIPAGRNVNVNDGGELAIVGAANPEYVGNGSAGYGTGTISGTTTLANGGKVSVTDGANVTFSGVITGDGPPGDTVDDAALILDGVGAAAGSTVTLTAANDFTGQTRVFKNSTLTVSGAGTLGASDGSLRNATVLVDEAQVVLAGKALGDELFFLTGSPDGTRAKIRGTGTSSVAGDMYAQAVGGQYNEISTSGTLTLSGNLSGDDNVDAAVQRYYVFNGTGTININGRITDAVDLGDGTFDPSTGDNINVIKRGSGTLNINTATATQSDYWFGSTVVEAGTLKVASDGSGNCELQSSTIEVQSGAVLDVTDWQNDTTSNVYNLGPNQSLSGGGRVNAGASGTLGVFGDNVVSPGDGVGTLQVTGNVSISDLGGTVTGGAFNYELGNTTTAGGSENDLIAISGNLSTAFGGSGSMEVNASFVEHALAASGNYTLMSYSNVSAPGISGLTLGDVTDSKGNAVTFRSGTSLALNSTATAVRLQVVGNTIASRTWTGSVNGIWDKGGTANWSGGDNRFYDFDNVTFGATGTNKDVVVSPATVSPNTMTVDGGSYTFSGGDISAASVAVTGVSTVASFSNTVGGSVSVSSGGTLAGAGTFQDNVAVQSGSKLRVGAATLPVIGGGSGKISLNVVGNFNSPVSGMAGVGDASAANWNNSAPDDSTVGQTIMNLADDTGAATTADVVIGGSFNTVGIGGTPGQDADGTYNRNMLNGYVNSGNGLPGSFALTEIPYEAYDIYVYFASDVNTRTGSVTDGSTTYYYNILDNMITDASGNALFAQTTSTTNGAFPEANYAVFSGLTGDSQTISGSTLTDFVGISAIQIVAAAAAPVGETMTIEGNLDLAAGSSALFNIAASGRGDRLDIEGNLSIADGFILDVQLDGSVAAGSLEAGDSWNLFDFATSSGTFDEADFILPSLNGGLSWDTSSLLIDGVLSIIADGLAGDFNGDGVVNIADYTVWRDNLGGD